MLINTGTLELVHCTDMYIYWLLLTTVNTLQYQAYVLASISGPMVGFAAALDTKISIPPY